MKTVEALGGKVVYDAPLMMLDDVVEKCKTVTIGALSRMHVRLPAVGLY
jgi:hypothetical protein